MLHLWRIELLGQLRVCRSEQVITRFRSQKTAALLAYLAYFRQQQHAREALIDLFWPDGTLESGRQSLSMALSSLRHQLEPPGTPAGAVVVADRQNVGLNPAAVTTDTAEFETGLRTAGKAASRAEELQFLERYLDLYQGRLLPGFYDDWLVAEQERLAQLFYEAVRQVIALLEQSADYSRALEHARRAVSLDPLREEAHFDLMRLLDQAGQPVCALRQYRQLQQILEAELGETPSAVTRALAVQIARQVPASSNSITPYSAVPGETALAPALPTGTITLLLTEIEGSAAPGGSESNALKETNADLRALLRQRILAHGGCKVKETEDSFLIAFSAAGDALACALVFRHIIEAKGISLDGLSLRMALHSGDIEMVGEEYTGQVMRHALRLLTAAHGGQTLCSDATTALLRRDLPSGVQFKDLGAYRLQERTDSERVFQIQNSDSAAQEFPPLRAEQAHSGHLPLTFTRFFGREKEIIMLTSLLSGQSRLVTLTGPGGTGKTRLALEVARHLAERLSGAVWFVSLAALTDAGLIAGTIVDGLGLPRSGSLEPLEQVVEALSRQPSLLILDNFEQIVEEGASLALTLLERLPALTLLITSRQLLGLSGEREFAVPTLPIPNGNDAPEHLALYESAQLFMDRAQVARPDFQITRRNASALAELCDRLEGIPLALELAAARAQVLTPVQMLARMERRFDFLVSRKKDVSERHRTLRAAIDWSYRLLTPDLQRFFARLSVFQGGWTVEAAEAVCEAELALDLLEHLRECSLVQISEEADGMRFRMLETLREYAREQCSEEERARLSHCHAAYFLRLAETAEEQLQKSGVLDAWNEISNEQDNLRSALGWLLASAEERENGLLLMAIVAGYWRNAGNWIEARDWLQRVVTQDPNRISPGQAKVWNWAGNLAVYQGDAHLARSYHAKRLAIEEALGNSRGIAGALHNMGMDIMMAGDLELSRKYYEDSFARSKASEDKLSMSATLNNLGEVTLLQNDLCASRSYLEQGILLARELQRPVLEVLGQSGLAQVALAEHDYETAHRLFGQCLDYFRQRGEIMRIAQMLNLLGDTLHEMGRTEEALPLHEESFALAKDLKCEHEIKHALASLERIAARV